MFLEASTIEWGFEGFDIGGSIEFCLSIGYSYFWISFNCDIESYVDGGRAM